MQRPLLRALASVLLLTAGCGESPAPKAAPASGPVGVHTLDFAGARHTLIVRLLPDFRAHVPAPEDRLRQDLRIQKEEGRLPQIAGNGQRSVMVVDAGGAESFDRARACRDLAALRAAFPDASLYFSPQLRAEEIAAGTVFVALLERDGASTTTACVLLESIGDVTLTLRLAPGPARTGD